MSRRYLGGFITASYNPLLVPDAPTIGTATAGNAQISITFTAPTNVGGSAITGYTAIARNSSTGALISVNGSSSPIVITGLTNGDTYTVTVAATNVFGTGPRSADSNSASPVAPALPTLLTAGVTSGMTFYVDAAAPASYSGGSTITDISGFTGGGFSGTLTNVTYSSDNNGILLFNGTNSVINFGTNRPIGISQTSKTLCAWIKYSGASSLNPQGILDNEDTGTRGYGFWINRVSSSSASGWYWPQAATDIINSTNGVTNNWVFLAITVNYISSSSCTATFYYNNVNGGSGSSTNGELAVDSACTLRIGSIRSNTSFNYGGSIALVATYNRVLSGAELTTNYNACKERFGL